MKHPKFKRLLIIVFVTILPLLFWAGHTQASELSSSPIVGFSVNPILPHYATVRENGLLEITNYLTSETVGSYLIPLLYQDDLNNLDPFGFQVEDIVYSPSGDFIAVSTKDNFSGGLIYVTDWRNNVVQQIIGQVNLGRIIDMSWSPDETTMVVASVNGNEQLLISDIAIIDIDSGEIERTLANMDRIDGQGWAEVAWSSLGIIAYANDTTLEFWDTTTNSVLSSTAPSADTRDVVWSPDSQRLATLNADRTLQIWDMSDLSAPVKVMSLTAEKFLSRDMQWLDNTRVAVNLWSDIQIWNTATGVLEELIETDHFIFGIGVLDSGELAYTSPESVITRPMAGLETATPTP